MKSQMFIATKMKEKKLITRSAIHGFVYHLCHKIISYSNNEMNHLSYMCQENQVKEFWNSSSKQYK